MLPLNPAHLSHLLSEAVRLHEAGRLAEAEERYRSMLAVAPDMAAAAFHLGRLLAARKSPEALDWLGRAARTRPQEAAVWQAWAAAAQLLGDEAARDAVLAAARGMKLAPALLSQIEARLSGAMPAPVAQPRIGRAPRPEVKALLDDVRAGRMAAAERRALAILKAAPDSALAADVLGSARMALGRPDQALEAFRRSTTLEPGWGEGHLHLGQALMRLGRPAEALEPLARAAALSRTPARALVMLALAQARLGRQPQALAALKRAVEAEPRNAEAQFQLGVLHTDLRNFPEAEAALRASEAAGNRSAELQLRLGQVLLLQGDEAGAEACYEKGLSREPDHPMLLSRKGLLLQGRGAFAEAEALLRRAIALSPGTGEFYRLLSASLKMTADDPLLAEMQRRFDDSATAEVDRMHLGFALAKAMEDLKRHDRVFTYLRPANELMRKAHPYDIATRRAEVDGILRAFADFAPLPAEGRSDFAPAFVTGMPRSGTTLVEQIIASHSRMTGGGEVGVAAREVQKVVLDAQGRHRAWGDIAPDEVAAMGQRYEATLRRRFPDAVQVTDKSIQTHAWMGFIAEALPKAKFVVVRRDPRDTALSIYRNVFAENTHLYAYDLHDLGLYFRMFEELIDFWRAKMPGGFHEVQYEELVANPEAESRRLIAACGLDWEDACLNFHENKRRVETLSLYQVRQPIYATSTKAWERHREDLAGFIAALEGQHA
ncbi:tetratricopeptide repeat-containing sulfotransferase family protein [Cereibacter sphaeroides]|uniref:tetratricopeptide repeat-containing sulfotransferase family protein n=1 Tax=Cereibacter sphaeroides TaxID=1063 RepID=UPI001F3E3FC5|nr:tetratricopeptide repeat-containing sulfotransferase family protein [Cereibacter sphaeroides]MCE6967768.1 sulfotransferase [Cereibacter sphaeroides]